VLKGRSHVTGGLRRLPDLTLATTSGIEAGEEVKSGGRAGGLRDSNSAPGREGLAAQARSTCYQEDRIDRFFKLHED
jgi:hypothetical protein